VEIVSSNKDLIIELGRGIAVSVKLSSAKVHTSDRTTGSNGLLEMVARYIPEPEISKWGCGGL